REKAYDALREAKTTGQKQERGEKVRELKENLLEEYFPNEAEVTHDGHTRVQFNDAFYSLEDRVVRDLLLEGRRLDGRETDELRTVDCQVGILPRVHGSALFTRGETQSLC